MLYRSLSITYKGMKERGDEVSETREPKLKSMERALELLKYKLDDDYVQRAEKELGPLSKWDWEVDEDGVLIDRDTPEEKKHNRKVFKRARQIEEKEWKELWEIIKGTKLSKGGPVYDGSDMRGWWD
jgi:hypothetical protein